MATTCEQILALPGPMGPAGADGVDGADGGNGYTTTTASFTMPDGTGVSPDVVVSVTDSSWAGVSQLVFVSNAAGTVVGTFRVVSKPTATSLNLRNLEDGTGAYASNSAPGSTFAAGSSVSPGGVQGVAGASANAAPDSATYITQTPNGTLTGEQALSGLTTGLLKNTTATGVLSIVTQGVANGNVASVDDAGGLTNGEALFATAAGIESKTAANARTSLGLALGTNVQPQDAFLTSIAALGTAADKMLYTTGVDTAAETALTATGRALLASATLKAFNTGLGGVMPRYGLIGGKQSANLNGLGDITMSLATLAGTKYRVDRITVTNASISLTTARAGVFTAAGGGGTQLAADQVLSALTAAAKFLDLTLAAIAGTDTFTADPLYFRVGTAQGAAATADVLVFGWCLDPP